MAHDFVESDEAFLLLGANPSGGLNVTFGRSQSSLWTKSLFHLDHVSKEDFLKRKPHISEQ